MSLSATVGNGRMFNVIPFRENRKLEGGGQPNPADLGPADPPLIGPPCAQTVADLRFRRKVQRLLARGERPVAELLAEIGARYGLTAAINQMLDCYECVPDEALDVTNGGDFWSAPVHLVRGATE